MLPGLLIWGGCASGTLLEQPSNQVEPTRETHFRPAQRAARNPRQGSPDTNVTLVRDTALRRGLSEREAGELAEYVSQMPVASRARLLNLLQSDDPTQTLHPGAEAEPRTLLPGDDEQHVETPPETASPAGPTASVADRGEPDASDARRVDFPERRRTPDLSGRHSMADNAATRRRLTDNTQPGDSVNGATDLAEGTGVSTASYISPPRRDWRKQVRLAIGALREHLADGALEDDERIRLQSYQSLLHLILEDQDKAMEAFQDLSDDDLEFWRQTIMGLGILLDSEGPPKRAHRVVSATEHLQQGLTALAATGPLRLSHMAFCTKVDGFGDLEVFDSYVFRPGHEMVLYVEVENFCVEQTTVAAPKATSRRVFGRRQADAKAAAPMFETELQGRYEILDRDQRPVASRILPIARNSCRNHRRDFYIAYPFFMPERIAPGSYTLDLTIEDVKGHKYGNAVLDFRVK